MRKPFTSRCRAFYTARVWQRRFWTYVGWKLSHRIFSKEYAFKNLPHRTIRHTSKLIRHLGDSDIALQYNKVTNLKIATQAVHGILLRPGEYFSFCKTVGRPTAKRGFVEGLELSLGEARSGIGGGICQLSNLIHWMVMHSPLLVVARSNHSFDPFPDAGRVLPFGSGAAIFYNFVDLIVYNPTQETFQIQCKVGEHQLEGELYTTKALLVKYHVYQKHHRFTQHGKNYYRENEIWRDTISKGHNPMVLASEKLYANTALVKYPVTASMLRQGDALE